MTRESELATRDNFGGFNIKPIDFLFNFDNFPIDDQLVENYRQNTPGSRRSPYDLENAAQYALVDDCRNNAYGLLQRRRERSGHLPGVGRAGSDAARTANRLGCTGKTGTSARPTSTGRPTATTVSRSVASTRCTTSTATRTSSRARRSRTCTGRSPSGTMPSSKIVSTSATSWWSAVSGTTGTTPGRAAGPASPGSRATRRSTPNDPEAFFTNDSLFPAGPGPRLHEPAHPGVVPGDRPDQLPVLVRPPGAGAGLRGRAPGHQHRHQHHQHQQFLRQRPGLRPHHHVRVRHPSRVQRRHGARHRGVQQGQPVERRRPSGQRSRIRSGASPRTSGSSPTPTSATPAVSTSGSTAGSATSSTARWPTPTPASKNTGSDPDTYLDFGSRVLDAVSGGNSPPPQAILPDRLRPSAQPGHRRRLQLPGRLEEGLGHRDGAAERRSLHHVPLHQRHAVHAVLAGRRATRTWSRATTATGRSPSRSTARGCRRSRTWTSVSPRASGSASST